MMRGLSRRDLLKVSAASGLAPALGLGNVAPAQAAEQLLVVMWGAAWMVTAVFMLSNSPTPLYVHWQRQLGFSSGTLTVIFALPATSPRNTFETSRCRLRSSGTRAIATRLS